MLTVDELTDRNGGELCDVVEWWDCFHADPWASSSPKSTAS